MNKDKQLTELQNNILKNRLNGRKVTNKVIEEYVFKEPYIDTTLLLDSDKAGKLIAKHIKKKSHIALVTDYDADGISSAAVMYRSFKEHFNYPTNKLSVMLNRRRDGNGINDTLLGRIMTRHNESPIDILILADHGSSDKVNIGVLEKNGIRVILTDHHTIPTGDNYPSTPTVFVNNQREGSLFPKSTSGCFVAFVVMLSTAKALKMDYSLKAWQDIVPYVAITTISDVMSLAEPLNRAICRMGFEVMSLSKHPDKWSIIKDTIGMKPLVDYMDIGFTLAPLINSSGRMNKAEIGYKLLISNDRYNIIEYAEELKKMNMSRKRLQKDMIASVKEQILPRENKPTLITTIKTNVAINGIIAGQLGEVHNKPSVCFIEGKDKDGKPIMTGSARATLKHVNISKIFNTIKETNPDVFIKAGGHAGAGGCSLHKDKFETFKEVFDKTYSKLYGKGKVKLKPIKIDGSIKNTEITEDLIYEIDKLGPYGMDWDKVNLSMKIFIKDIKIYGNFALIEMIDDNNNPLKGMYSIKDMDTINKLLDKPQIATVIGIPQFNMFMGQLTIQFNINSLHL